MELKVYLQSFSTSNTLYIVGPFYDESIPFTEPVVFVDRGVFFRKTSEGVSVGDGDSAGFKLQHQLEHDKDLSDLAFVLENIPSHFERVHLLGFLGHRKDHELMNWAEAHRCLKSSTARKVLHFDQSIQAFSKGQWSITVRGTFSIFSFEPCDVKLTGQCKFKIEGFSSLKALSSHGLSNEGFGDIEISTTGPVFLFNSLSTNL